MPSKNKNSPGKQEQNGFFSEKDFDAYFENKWKSNMFNRERLEVKQKLLSFVPVINEILDSQGISLEHQVTDEHPSLWNKKQVSEQWLFFSRGKEERKNLQDIIDSDKKLAHTLADTTPYFKHVFIGLMINHQGLETGIRIHRNAWVDWQNLVNRLNSAGEFNGFLDLLESLPDRFEIGVTGSDLSGTGDFSAESWENIKQDFSDQEQWFFIGHRISRDAVSESPEESLELIREDFSHLCRIYGFFAWTRGNNFISIENEVRQQEEHRHALREEHEKQRDIRDAMIKSREAERKKLRAKLEEKVRAEEEWKQREIAARRAHARQRAREEQSAADPDVTSGKPVQKTESSIQRPQEVKKKETRQAKKPAAVLPAVEEGPIEVNSSVRIKNGVFRGKHGQVQELKKDSAKVLLGIMATWIDLDEIERVPTLPQKDRYKGRRKK